MATCSGNACTTTQDQPVTLKLAELGTGGLSFDYATVSQGTVGSRVELNGVPMDTPSSTCGTNSVHATSADFNAGNVVWRPANGISQSNGLGSPTVVLNYCLNNGAPVSSQTLTMTVADVNDAPLISGNLLVNGNFAVRPVPEDIKVLPGWTIGLKNPTILDPAIQYAYGGMTFNSGDKAPNGVATQSFATTVGEIYKGRLRTTYGGNPSNGQNILVQFIDNASGNVLYQGSYGQGKEGAFTFVATSGNTSVKITDISTDTLSTDIALSEISVEAPMLPQTTLEDKPYLIASQQTLDIADPDGPSTAAYNHVLTLTVQHGTLAMGSLPPPMASWDHSMDGLRAVVTGTGSSLTLTGNPAGINFLLGTLTYTPNLNYYGPDTLALSLNDLGNVGMGPQGQPSPYPLTTNKAIPITVIPVNDPPTGQDNAATTRLNAPYTFKSSDFSTGFSDVADNPSPNQFAGIVIASLPAKGVLQLAGTPIAAGQSLSAAQIAQLVWTPPAGESGAALTTFNFRVRDDGGVANGGQDLAQNANVMTLNVTPVPNSVPKAQPDTYHTNQGVAVTLTPTPLSNDSDPDGDALQITVINGTPTTPGTAQTIAVPHGSLAIDASGGMVFTPDSTYSGSLQFGYTIADGFGGKASSTISITVAPIVPPNQAPVANPDTYTTTQATAVALTPLGNDTDGDGDVLQLTSINGIALAQGSASIGQVIAVPDGSVTVGAGGSLTFTPNATFTGDVNFPYTISDGRGGNAASTITIHVTAPSPQTAVPVPGLGTWALGLLSALLAFSSFILPPRRKSTSRRD